MEIPRGRITARPLLAAAFVAVMLGAPHAKEKAQRGWDHYKKRAHILKNYRDKQSLDDKGILRILEDAGVLQPLKSTTDRRGHPSLAKGFTPFKVRVYNGTWLWPLRYGVVSSEFGKRWGKSHKGIDIAADEGDKIYAAAPGEVIYSSDSVKGYGKLIIIRHDLEMVSLYAHNSELQVKTGQRVRTGQLIARVGSTGRSTGPHIHFEIKKGRKAVDPRKVLPKSRF